MALASTHEPDPAPPGEGVAAGCLLVEVHRRLTPLYGLPTLGNKPDPLDELIYIFLSARTGYKQFEPLYDRLKRAYPTWDDLACADVAEIEAAIRDGGLSHKRAEWLKALLAQIPREEGRLSLDCLRALDDEAAEELLCSLPGVGPKTARCVLMYSLHRDLFPLDTHARRVLERLGILNRFLHQLKANDVAQSVVPPGYRRSLHILFVVHGRTICRARKPSCDECALLDLCPHGEKVVAESRA